jgi:hypothetical protein
MTTVYDCTSKIYRHDHLKAEVITWRDESAITIFEKNHILFREAFFSHSGTNGNFIEDGAWSPDGNYFAFRLLSSGGHMPYRNPVKIFKVHDDSKTLIDAEKIIAKIPHISNIAVGPFKKPYLLWLSDTQLQVSVESQDKKSDSGLYVIDLETLSAKKKSMGITQKKHVKTDLTVPRGTPLRKKILNALRKQVKEVQNIEMVFVVDYIKAKGNWAWVHTFPQSKDGKNHYEDISALLNRQNGNWKVVEWACTDDTNIECIGHPKYFMNLKKHFPGLPEEILPRD